MAGAGQEITTHVPVPTPIGIVTANGHSSRGVVYFQRFILHVEHRWKGGGDSGKMRRSHHRYVRRVSWRKKRNRQNMGDIEMKKTNAPGMHTYMRTASRVDTTGWSSPTAFGTCSSKHIPSLVTKIQMSETHIVWKYIDGGRVGARLSPK